METLRKKLLGELSSSFRLSSSRKSAHTKSIEAKCKPVERELETIQEVVTDVYNSRTELTTLESRSEVYSKAIQLPVATYIKSVQTNSPSLRTLYRDFQTQCH